MINSAISGKKILIISQDFIPYSSSLGGVLRVITLAEYLFKNGYEVYVLASKGYYYDYFGYAELCKKINISYIADSQKKRNFNISPTITISKTRSNHGILAIIKRIISDFLIPDKGIRLIPRYFFKASSLISQFGITNVLTSSPPHSTQIIGLLLKMKRGVNLNLIVDYRDNWNASSIFGKKFFFNKYISCKLEKSLLKKTDRFLFVSEPMLSKVEKLHNIKISEKSALIMNGFSTKIDMRLESVTKNGKIQIGYFGSISDDNSSFRNICSLLYCLKTCKEISDRIEFHFYGPVTLKYYNIADFKNIFIHKSVEHHEALIKMAEMDYLLIVHSDTTNSDEVITGKFFEYISVQKPIICLAPENMEAVRMIKRYNIGLHIEITDNQEIIDKFLSLKKQMDNSYKQIDVNDFSREKQYVKILNLMR